MKVVIIGACGTGRIAQAISKLQVMGIQDILVIAEERPGLSKHKKVIDLNDADTLSKILVYHDNATQIHDDLYALTPGPDPGDIPLIREKKKKLPRKIRKFAGYN